MPTGRPMRCALLWALLQCAGLAQPSLVLDTQPYDFGKVAPDALLRHTFALSNGGTEPLVLGRVSTSCGCTTGLLGKDTLEPGESTELAVTFNTAGLRGRSRKTVQIASNDPANPVQTLTFEPRFEIT